MYSDFDFMKKSKEYAFHQSIKYLDKMMVVEQPSLDDSQLKAGK